jgi:hypothetical protein
MMDDPEAARVSASTSEAFSDNMGSVSFMQETRAIALSARRPRIRFLFLMVFWLCGYGIRKSYKREAGPDDPASQ